MSIRKELLRINEPKTLLFDKEKPFIKFISIDYNVPAKRLNDLDCQIYLNFLYEDGGTTSEPLGVVGQLTDDETKLNISYNLIGIKAPSKCIEYVITHELCHTVHHNHNKQFYALHRNATQLGKMER